MNLQDDWGLGRVFLGTLDTVFLVSYAVGLYISGQIGDRFQFFFYFLKVNILFI